MGDDKVWLMSFSTFIPMCDVYLNLNASEASEFHWKDGRWDERNTLWNFKSISLKFTVMTWHNLNRRNDLLQRFYLHFNSITRSSDFHSMLYTFRLWLCGHCAWHRFKSTTLFENVHIIKVYLYILPTHLRYSCTFIDFMKIATTTHFP